MSKRLFSRARPYVPLRGIHLDLKGNPPTPKRLLQLLDVCAGLKLNAVLAEWEDTFPWRRYPELKSPTAYSRNDIERFMQRARKLGIEVISLVQCFGHAENVLSKPRFRALREIKDNVAEFCPSNPRSARVIIEMIDDVLALTGPGVRTFHLGGDEAWHMGSCPRCRRAISRRGRGELYLSHVGPILDHLARRGIRPILWDDMMRKWPAQALSKLSRRADLMAWSYGANPLGRHLSAEHLKRFKRAGITVWAGSAYKGGDGAYADRPDMEARMANNLAWARLCGKHSLAGMVATAWSRYNTFLSPCETIDASLDAMVLCAAAMWDGRLPRDAEKRVPSILRRLRGGAEAGIFARCRKAAADLAAWREGGIAWHLSEAEHSAHINGEPERANPAIIKRHLRGTANQLRRGKRLGEAFVRAHRGLIPDRWLKLYAASRLNPLARRFKALPRK